MSHASAQGAFVFPASFAQRRLWFIEQVEDSAGAYNVSFALRLRGELDPRHLAEALGYLEDRHEALRTTFAMEGGALSQVVHPPGLFPLRVEQLPPSGTAADADLTMRLQSESLAPFDLRAGPLIRALLLETGRQDHVLVITMHHSIVDAWSIEILLRELAEAYDATRAGRRPALAPLPIQYADYSVWQAEHLTGEVAEAELEYWRRRLAGPLPVLELPTDHPRAQAQTYRGDRVVIDIGPEVAGAVRRLARESNATLFMTLLASYQLFLHRHAGQTDLVTGTPISGRNQPETAGLIGCFLNTLAIRTDLSGVSGFPELLAQVRATVLEAYGAQAVPFEMLVDALHIPRDLSRHPVFQAAFVFQPAPEPLQEFSGLTVTRLPLPHSGTSKFDFVLSIDETGTGLRAEFEYNTDLFDRSTAERMAERYRVLLAGIADAFALAPGKAPSLARLPILTDAERTLVLETWNRTGTDYPRHRCVHELFEEMVDSTPEAVAIIAPPAGGGGVSATCTYRELDRRANRLAHRLRRLGVGASSSVGIAIERSTEFIVSALATLKAGGAYVPIDLSLPADRVAGMLEDADARVVLTVTRLEARLPSTGVRTLRLDADAEEIRQEPDTRLTHDADPGSPASLMFTSGSSGRPKGVLIAHRGIVRLVRDAGYLRLSAGDVMLGCATVSFDASTFEIWGSLLNGARLVIHPDPVPHPRDIAALIAEHHVTTTLLTTGLFHLMAETNPAGFAGLRQLFTGGDVLAPTLARKAMQHLGGGELINAYGPTENTVITCCHALTAESDIGASVPIGRPISNTRVYVLDEFMGPVPIGVRGELWTSGEGLALGYRNDAGLTAERFVPDPFSDDPDARIYRTGDLVRYRADGALEFLGRADTQVKVRGFRIELAEIEGALRRHPAVADAVVIARNRANGDKQLLAYVVGGEEAQLESAELKGFLRDRLPHYAVPSVFVTLPSLPLAPSGKVDRNALPEPAGIAQQQTRTPNGLETQLLLIWEDVLARTGITVDDNFFDLGGNSLRAIAMLTGVEKALGRRVPVSALYQGQTITAMADALSANRLDSAFRAIAIQQGGSRPPLFVVPGVNGNVLGYEVLARSLDPDRPFYALRSAGLDGEVAPLETVEAIAASHLSELRRVQPKGPYHLLGFCMGGIIAYEMAQQLSAQGEATALLVLVDSWAPGFIASKPQASRFVRLAFLGRGLARHLRGMWKRPRGQRLRYLLEKASILTEMIEHRDVYRGEQHQRHRDLVVSANQRAAAHYVPAPYDGGVLLILSNEVTLAPEADPRLSWQSLARGASGVVRLPGKDSGSLLRQPFVEGLADVLRKRLVESIPSAT